MSTTEDVDTQWGGDSDVMNAFETLMWRVEEGSPFRSTCIAIELLDGTPDWDQIVEVHDRLTRLVPRLRQHVVAPPFGLAFPRWADDPYFDLHYHLHRRRLTEGAGWPELLEAAAKWAMTGFDRARPPWEAALYEGMPDGKSAYLLKLHHSISDGLGIMRLMSFLHPPAGRSTPDVADGWAPPGKGMSPLSALCMDTLEGVRKSPDTLLRAGMTTMRALATPAESARYAASLRRVLTPPAAQPSPLLRERSTNWRFAALDVDFPALRAAGKAVGGTLNDAYLASLLGGYRRYHEALGAPPQPILIAIPMSLRSAEEATGGNEIATARLAAPMDIVDPAKRMQAIGEQIRSARDEPAMNNINLLSPALAKLPPGVIAQVVGGLTKAHDLQASNVPGAREDVFLAGVRVERLYGYAPLPGCPAMVAMITHGKTCCVGVNYDSAAIVDPPEFVRCLAAGFEEVLAVGGHDAPAVITR